MKTKDLIPFAIAALVFSVIFQFFMSRYVGKDGDHVLSGKKIVAPKAVTQIPELHQPLNTEIDFVDKEVDRPEELITVDTPLMKLDFSNHGGVIQAISIKRVTDKKVQEFETFSVESPVSQREAGAFLLAFNEKTPYFYEFVSREEENDGEILTYKTEVDTCKVTKRFKVYNEKNQIDLSLMIEGGLGKQVRLFLPGPTLQGMVAEDVVHGIMNNPKNVVQKEPRRTDLVESYWPEPTLFGVEDRYFVHTMVKDGNKFALRAFYMFSGVNSLSSIIESYPIKEQMMSWDMSFYVGPKELTALNAVDHRLEETLDYGFWAPISKFLLAMMKFIYKYLPNYGFVIILLTILIKLLLLPFSFKQGKAMKSREELQRKLAYIEQKYKHDRETLMREKAELIRKHGMPDMLGCLPVLVQLPIFYALNRVLNNSIELFRAPFVWITDLSAPDPWYILPLLVTLGMLVSFASVGDIRQRLPFFLISLIIGAVMANLAAGLALFFATSTWITVAENQAKKTLGV